MVCKFCSDDNVILSSHKDSVLRIRKPRGYGMAHDLDFLRGYEARVNDVLYPNGPSLRSSKFILSSSFVDELSRHIHTSRPARFRSNPIGGSLVGEVMPNVLKMFKKPYNAEPSSYRESPSIVSLEIKIKGGHPSVSPFLKGASRIKRQYGRHHLKQLANLDDPIELETALYHCPLDLGSRNYDTIRTCLSDLVKLPQKILRCYLDGKPALGSFSYSSIPDQENAHIEMTWSALCNNTWHAASWRNPSIHSR